MGRKSLEYVVLMSGKSTPGPGSRLDDDISWDEETLGQAWSDGRIAWQVPITGRQFVTHLQRACLGLSTGGRCRLGLASGSVALASVKTGGLAWAGPSAGKSRSNRVELGVFVCPLLALLEACQLLSHRPKQIPGPCPESRTGERFTIQVGCV